MKSVTTFKNITRKSLIEQDEWVAIEKKAHHNNYSDKVRARAVQTASGGFQLDLAIGADICELLGWQKGDYITVMRSRIRPHLLRFVKGEEGYKLGDNANNMSKRYLKFALEGKNYIAKKTFTCEYDVSDEGLIIDITNLLN